MDIAGRGGGLVIVAGSGGYGEADELDIIAKCGATALFKGMARLREDTELEVVVVFVINGGIAVKFYE
ncbi:14470_t:CDS:1 [Racocetra fulgida]|uniref:14470_t:CDS:1 n=1 Tax=Racocetra fulgida TaxID=60492 RepID=A0A9N9DI88_9GLOM|nr:14470_t:CDS:1 [Racocetra fulgida]